MATWKEFTEAAPRIAALFARRLEAAGNLCMVATLRSDGFPRISPMEPSIMWDELWVGGMPDTTKSKDLRRDPRFCLHTATVDTHLKEGDAKLWGRATEITDQGFRLRYASRYYEETGFDVRSGEFDLFSVDITAASGVESGQGQLDITVWKTGEAERMVHK